MRIAQPQKYNPDGIETASFRLYGLPYIGKGLCIIGVHKSKLTLPLIWTNQENARLNDISNFAGAHTALNPPLRYFHINNLTTDTGGIKVLT